MRKQDEQVEGLAHVHTAKAKQSWSLNPQCASGIFAPVHSTLVSLVYKEKPSGQGQAAFC